jgi:hypothetical protein
MDKHTEETAKIHAMMSAIGDAIHDGDGDDAAWDPVIVMPALLAMTGYVLSYANDDVPLRVIYENVLKDIERSRQISIAHTGALDLFDRLRGKP